MRHDLTGDEHETVDRHLRAAADQYGLRVDHIRNGCWLLPGPRPAWVLAWKTAKGRYRLHVFCGGWTYDRRTHPGDLPWLLPYLGVAVGGVAALNGKGPR